MQQALATELRHRSDTCHHALAPEEKCAAHPGQPSWLEFQRISGNGDGSPRQLEQFAALQRTLGNQAVLRMLDRAEIAGGKPSGSHVSTAPDSGHVKNAASLSDRSRARSIATTQVMGGIVSSGSELQPDGPSLDPVDPIHAPLIAQYRQAMGQPPHGIDPETGQQVGPTDAELKYGGLLSQWLAAQSQSTQNQPPACSPTLQTHQLTLGKPVAFPSGATCKLRLAGSGTTLNGMEFKGQIQAPANCPGKVYIVQYAKLNRAFTGCFGNKPEGFCIKRGWGLDTAWPYPFGSQTTIPQAGISAPIQSTDSPGADNISDTVKNLVRVCLDDEFVSYIVFEDAAGHLTSLGWMNWMFTAYAERDTGQCPPTSTATDCSGWKASGIGTPINSDFTVGTSGPQPLDRTVKVVNAMPDDCPDTSCAKQ